MFSSKSKLVISAFSLLIIVLLTACNANLAASTSGTYSIDPIFADFYRQFGGASILGPAISPLFVKEAISYQYIVSGLIVYDPNQDPLRRFHFSPIATMEWRIHGQVEPAPADSSLPYVNGHRIWEEVWPFYSHYGSDVLGLPLTGVSANDEKQRYEQYFEGVGFYRSYSDPQGQIHLLPYGAWMCGVNCSYQGSDVIPPSASYARDYSETEQLFLQESERLGYGFTGAPLTTPQMAADGNIEMVFENAILFLDPSSGNQVRLRPLPSMLGIQADLPTNETKTGWLSFYQVSEGLGFNVPNLFNDYIVSHGGDTYAGYPITEYSLLQDGGYTQCYTNMCLEYHPTAPEALRVRPHALGLVYHSGGGSLSASDSTFAQALQINVWEQYPLISSGERQVITIEASQNEAPIRGIELSLLVKQPDGVTKTYQPDPTGEDGRTSIELDPIDGPNGSIIQYQVCVIGSVTPQICFSRSYTIWE